MGLAQSSEAGTTAAGAESFDLALDIAVDDHAIAPEYPTSGSAAFSIFAPQDLTVSSDAWTHVRTGLTFRMPFMLIISIQSCKPCLIVHPTLVDCDEDENEVIIPIMYRPGGPGHERRVQQMTLKRGEVIASGIVLPIARPGFRLYSPDVERV